VWVNIKNRLKLAVKLTVENLKSGIQKHHDRTLQLPWNFAQLGMLIFPLIPILGALGIFLGLIGTTQKKISEISRRPVNRGFAMLSVLLIIAAVFANNRIEAFLGLGNLFPFFILFATFSSLIQTPAQLRQLSWLLVISSIPVIILGLGQQFLGWSGIVQLQPVFGWVLEPTGNPPGRMASVFMYANILACYLTIVFILALGLWIEKVSCQLSVGSWQLSPITNDQSPMTNSQFPIPNSQFLFLTLRFLLLLAQFFCRRLARNRYDNIYEELSPLSFGLDSPMKCFPIGPQLL
jgi:hypothetical protein